MMSCSLRHTVTQILPIRHYRQNNGFDSLVASSNSSCHNFIHSLRLFQDSQSLSGTTLFGHCSLTLNSDSPCSFSVTYAVKFERMKCLTSDEDFMKLIKLTGRKSLIVVCLCCQFFQTWNNRIYNFQHEWQGRGQWNIKLRGSSRYSQLKITESWGAILSVWTWHLGNFVTDNGVH